MGCAVGVHRLQTPNTMLLVVMQYIYKFRIGPRLISVDAQDTTQTPILTHSTYATQFMHSFIFLVFLHTLFYQLLNVRSSQQGHSPKATKNPPGIPSKLPVPAPKNAKIPPERSSKHPEPAPKITKTPSDSSTKLPNQPTQHLTRVIFGRTLLTSLPYSPETPPIQPHPLNHPPAVPHTPLRQLAASSIKLPIHSPKTPHTQTGSSSKSPKPAPKPAYTPPLKPPKCCKTSLNCREISLTFPDHSPKSSDYLPENSPKSSTHFPNITPSLLKHFPKFSNSTPEFDVLHCLVYTYQHLTLRNHFIKSFCIQHTLSTTQIMHSFTFLVFLNTLFYQLSDVSSSKLLGHSPKATKNPPGNPSKLPLLAPKMPKSHQKLNLKKI